MRYSGSPLPYSFGERTHRKAVWIADLDETGLRSVERIDLPVVRPLTKLTGTLDTLLGDHAYAEATEHYVSATLTDPVRPLDAMRKLQERFPHAVHVEWQRPASFSEGTYRDKVRGRSDVQIAEAFLGEGYTAKVRAGMTYVVVSLLKDVLLERGLLKMLGRKDEPGRPLLYGTTPFFLDFLRPQTPHS